MVRVGAIGLGGLAYLELDVLAGFPDVEIVAGADVAPEARELFEAEFGVSAYDDYEAMLSANADDLDAALITTPHALHFEHAMACLERGLDVYVEKPMVTDVGDAVELVETADEASAVLQVGYQRHFHPGFQELKRLIDDGRLGDLHTVDCYLAQEWIRRHQGTWRVEPRFSGGGQLYDSGSHLLDVLLWMTSAEPAEVAARIEFNEPRLDVNSALAITLDCEPRPVIASVGVSGDGIAVEPSEGYFIWGTEGRATYAEDEITLARKGGVVYTAHIESETDFHTLTRKKLANFVASVRGEEVPAVPGEVGLAVTALTEAAYRAAETGKTVDVQAIEADPPRAADESN